VIPRARALPASAGLLVVTVLAMSAGPAAQQPAQQQGQPARFDRVLDPPTVPDDARLTAPHDLDHPYKFAPDFKTKEDWLARRTVLRQQVQVAMGLWPLPERSPITPIVHGHVDRDSYTIEDVAFASYPGHYVTGNLYRPKNAGPGRKPAVLTPYGHWKDGRFYTRTDEEARKQVANGADTTLEAAKYPEQARCAMLARLGYVVFHYDLVGYADSQQIAHGEGFTDAEAELRLQSFMGLQSWNSVRALDFLISLPDVDPARVVVTGASGGGTQTIILDAIDDRPVAAFPAVMVSGAMQGGCVCENTWLLRVGTNNIEIAAAFAPKPMGLSAANDWTRDIMTLGLPELQTIYGLFGADDKVTAWHFSFEHNFNQVSREMMYNWFNTQLTLGAPSPISEKPFVPALRPELTVFDAAHPRPKDASDAAGLRAQMTRASDAQMIALARDPAAYRETVGTALRAIVNDPIAKPGTVTGVRSTYRELHGKGFDVHQIMMMRAGSGEVFPNIGLIPADSDPVHKGSPLVIWTHPDGKRSLFEADGVTPVPAVRWLLDQHVFILAPDVFLTGEFQPQTAAAGAAQTARTRRPTIKDQDKFAGYNDGYNRTVLANRVRDLLTVVAFAQQLKPTAIHLVAFDRAGVWALLARGLAGDAIARASIDLGGFDFTQVREPDDEMMLPGGLKYGGLLGFAPLFAATAGATELYRAPSPAAPWLNASSPSRAALLGPHTTIRQGAAAPPADQMVRWVVQQGQQP
jgi:hypothetical protein